MKRIGVISNPRSGTSLMVRLILTCFDTSLFTSLFPCVSNDNDVYGYRIMPENLLEWGDEDYYVIYVLRDPRSVVVSKHPSTGKYLIDFGTWFDNYIISIMAGFSVNFKIVLFDELIATPDKIQCDLATFFNIPIINCFSKSHLYSFPNKFVRTAELEFEMGGVRKLFQQDVLSWKKEENRNRIVSQLRDYQFMASFITHLGFEPDDAWLQDLY